MPRAECYETEPETSGFRVVPRGMNKGSPGNLWGGARGRGGDAEEGNEALPFESLFGRLSSQQTKSAQLLVSEYYLLTVVALFQVTYSR
jgi:hypothetical protein